MQETTEAAKSWESKINDLLAMDLHKKPVMSPYLVNLKRVHAVLKARQAGLSLLEALKGQEMSQTLYYRLIKQIRPISVPTEAIVEQVVDGNVA